MTMHGLYSVIQFNDHTSAAQNGASVDQVPEKIKGREIETSHQHIHLRPLGRLGVGLLCGCFDLELHAAECC
jgi:hypothetical protein